MARYTSHIWMPYPTRLSGGSYTGGPKKLVVHRTQGTSAEGSFAAYNDGGVPHFTWEYKNGAGRVTKRKFQHFDTDIAASALRNESGGVQTNRDGAIQVEIVGFSEDTRFASDDELRWYGEAIRELCEVEGIDMHRYPEFYDQRSGFTLATRTAGQRMSYAAWDSFNGVCGHQHVPENTHWDPGALDYPRMLSLIGPSTPSQEDDDDMAFPVIAVKNDPARTRWLALTAEGAVHVPNPEYYSVGVNVGLFKPVKFVGARAYDVAKDMANRIDPEHAGAHDVLTWYAAAGDSPMHNIIRQVVGEDSADAA